MAELAAINALVGDARRRYLLAKSGRPHPHKKVKTLTQADIDRATAHVPSPAMNQLQALIDSANAAAVSNRKSQQRRAPRRAAKRAGTVRRGVAAAAQNKRRAVLARR